MWSIWLVFCDCGFHSVCSLMAKDKRLMEASWWERLTMGETGSCSNGWGHAWTQFSVDGWGCVPSLCFDPRPNYGGLKRTNGELLLKDLYSVPLTHSRPLSTHTSLETPGHSQASLAQSLVGTLLPSPGSWCAQGFVCAQYLFVCSMLLVLSFFLHFSHSDRRG